MNKQAEAVIRKRVSHTAIALEKVCQLAGNRTRLSDLVCDGRQRRHVRRALLGQIPAVATPTPVCAMCFSSSLEKTSTYNNDAMFRQLRPAFDQFDH